MKRKPRRVQRRRAKPAAKPRKKARAARPAQKVVDAIDLEDLLINEFLGSSGNGRNILVEDVFYNITPSIADLGYKYGFSVGMHIYTKTHEGARNIIPDILEKLNFGKVLYNPFSDKLIITSTGRRAMPLRLGKNLHIYEAGIIAGYMSMATGLKLDANEVHCIYNNSDFCQFVCSPLTTPNFHLHVEGNRVVETLASALGAQASQARERSDYSILHMLPLLREPLLDEMAALLDLAGTKLAKETPDERVESTLNSMARNLGVEKLKLDLSKKRKSLKLRYGRYNSLDDFVTLSIQPFIGFTTEKFGSEASVYKTINQDRTYTARIELRKKVSR